MEITTERLETRFIILRTWARYHEKQYPYCETWGLTTEGKHNCYRCKWCQKAKEIQEATDQVRTLRQPGWDILFQEETGIPF